MTLRDRYDRNTGDKPDAIPSGDRFIASGQQQSPGQRPGPRAPGGHRKDAKDEGTPIPDIEPRTGGRGELARAGEKGTSSLDPASGKDPDEMPPPRSQRERGNPNADASVRSYKDRDPEV
jgi:hypothetical protein